jgi:hypothetical protein
MPLATQVDALSERHRLLAWGVKAWVLWGDAAQRADGAVAIGAGFVGAAHFAAPQGVPICQPQHRRVLTVIALHGLGGRRHVGKARASALRVGTG